MRRVALVFPYFRTRAPTEMLFPPLGVATLAAQLRRLEVETRVFDCTFGTFAQLRTALSSYRPDIVGIYSMVSLTRNTLKIAEMVTDAPSPTASSWPAARCPPCSRGGTRSTSMPCFAEKPT